MIEDILKEIANAYSKLDCVYAVVLSGSRTSNQSDELSDYDIYVYTDKEIPLPHWPKNILMNMKSTTGILKPVMNGLFEKVK